MTLTRASATSAGTVLCFTDTPYPRTRGASNGTSVTGGAGATERASHASVLGYALTYASGILTAWLAMYVLTRLLFNV